MPNKNQTEKLIKNSALYSTSGKVSIKKNTPVQYKDRQHQYYAERTAQFVSDRAEYASDYVKADVQGLCADDFYKYLTTYVRFSDMVSQTATTTKNVDDLKHLLFKEPSIDYFPVGAKVQTMGSTWLCVNPSNISSVHGTAVVYRCNASYGLYDYYGNIVTEPIVVEKKLMASNDNAHPENIVLMEGYFNVTCQLNEYTRRLGQSKRIILGSKAYHITGFTDFIQEFTGDYDSVHILQFTVRIEEPTIDDDLVNHIENGRNYTFSATVDGATNIKVGETSQLTAQFVKNGEAVAATEEYPLTWQWISSDETVATVDENGNVTAKNAGKAQIIAVLAECERVTSSVEITIEEAQTTPYVAFTGVIPKAVQQYTAETFTAGYYKEGALSDEAVEWSFSGASESAYHTVANGNSVTVSCLRSDSKPLTITATCNGQSASVNVWLESY